MKSNTRFKRNDRGIKCLNCHQPLSTSDNFCSNCGQVNDLKPLSIKQYISEFFSGFFAFDTRTLNTIVPLIFKPGKVTKEYIHGERMKYVNPFQLYLHTSIIFFLITGIFLSIDKYDSITKSNVKTTSKINKEEGLLKDLDSIKGVNSIKKDSILFAHNLNSELATNKPKKDPKQVKSVITNKKIRENISIKIERILIETQFLTIIKDSTISNYNKETKVDTLLTKIILKDFRNIKKNYRFENDSLKKFNKFKKQFLHQFEKKLKTNNITYIFTDYIKLSSDNKMLSNFFGRSLYKKLRLFKMCETKNVANALDSLGYPKTRRNVFLFNKAQNFNKFGKDAEFKRTYLNNMISKTSIVLFFMLPIFTLFLRLIYIRKKINYTEHLIFTFHLQTVFFLLLLLTIILFRIFNSNLINNLFFLFFAVYLFIAMKKFYQQNFIKTFIKYILLNLMYFILSAIGSLIVAVLAFVI